MKLLVAALTLAWASSAQGDVGEARASFDTGRMYRHGTGVARDSGRAFTLIEASALKRHAPAMFTLSNMLAAGEGRPADLALARHWLQAAADLEYPEAMQQLAMNLRDGAMGYERDEVLAAHLLRKMAHAMKHRHQH